MDDSTLTDADKVRLAELTTAFMGWWMDVTGGPGLSGQVRRCAMEEERPLALQSYVAGAVSRDEEVDALKKKIEELDRALKEKAE